MQGDVEVVREILHQQGLVSGGNSGDIVQNGSQLVSIDKLASVRRCNSHFCCKLNNLSSSFEIHFWRSNPVLWVDL